MIVIADGYRMAINIEEYKEETRREFVGCATTTIALEATRTV